MDPDKHNTTYIQTNFKVIIHEPSIKCRCLNGWRRTRINVIVLELLEKEDLQKLQKKWWYDKGQCVVETDNKVCQSHCRTCDGL